MLLRDYQDEIIRRLGTAWQQGARSVMLQMPTGTGKTIVAARVIADACREQARVLVVAHRHEILDQIRDALTRHDLSDALADGRIGVDSIQHLSRNLHPDGGPALVVIDEAHHATAKTYRLLWEAFPEARFLGLTATPCRLKKEGFGTLFDKLVCSRPVRDFILGGWLADYDFVSVGPDSEMRERIRSLKKRGADGDYQPKELGTVMDNRAAISQLYRSYQQYAAGKQGIIYAINREHAAHIRDYYEAQGERTALIDAKTPASERTTLLYKYRAGEIRILVNCEIYTEGYDAPFVQFVQLARPTLSLSKYLQQVGRGLRPNRDGTRTVILDNVAMYYLFGLPDAYRDWDRMFRCGQVTAADSTPALQGRSSASPYGDEGHTLGMVRISRDDAMPGSVADLNRKHIGEGDLSEFQITTQYGLTRYRDSLTGYYLPCRPSVLKLGAASFIEETDGWHLRHRALASVPFRIEDIRLCGDDVRMTHHPSGREYLCFAHGRHHYLMRLLGTDPDGSLLLAPVGEGDTVYRRCGSTLTVHRRPAKGSWEYARCDAALHDNPAFPASHEPRLAGYGQYLRVICRNGCYGWAQGETVLCEPRFPAIHEFRCDRYVLVSRPSDGRRVVVDRQGNVLYDRHDIARIDCAGRAYYTTTVAGKPRTCYVHLATGTVHNDDCDFKGLGPFLFRKERRSRPGTISGWHPLTFGNDDMVLCDLFLDRDILHAIGSDDSYIIAFRSNPTIFYRVLSRRPDAWQVMEPVSRQHFLFVAEQQKLVASTAKPV